MKEFLPIIALALAFVSCGKRHEPQLSQSGIGFKNDLIEAIHSAEAIKITEYSHKLDYNSSDSTWKAGQVYKEIKLTTAQKLRLLQGAINMHPGYENDAVIISFCYEPHHTIHFISPSGKTDELEICFSCNRIQWAGTTHAKPESFLPTLARLFTEFGLSPKADWQALANRRSATSSLKLEN